MAYTISWQDKGVIIHMTGQICFSDIQEANSLLFGDSRFDIANFQLWDFTDITSFDLQGKPPLILSTLDKQAMQWNPKMKIAVISNNHSLSRFADQYGEQIESTAWKYRHFNSLNDALKWVDPLVL